MTRRIGAAADHTKGDLDQNSLILGVIGGMYGFFPTSFGQGPLMSEGTRKARMPLANYEISRDLSKLDSRDLAAMCG